MNKIFLPCLLLIIVLSLAGCGDNTAKKLYDEASAALENGEFESAESIFNEVVSNGEYLPDSYRGIGIAQLNQAKFSDSAISFSKALLNAKDNDTAFIRDVNMYLAYSRYAQGNPDEALRLYNELIDEEEDADLLYLRGRIHMANGDFEKAESDFYRAAEISDDYNLYISIYETYANYRMGANGSEFLERAMAVAEDNAEDHYSRGLIYYYLQNYDDAREELITALKKNSNDEKVMMLLGKTYLAMGDVADARAMYKEHINNDSIAADAYNGMALCDMAEDNYKSAMENIKKGLEYHDEEANKSLLFNQILIYEHFEDWETAKTLAEQYVRAYPLEDEGLREYAFLESR